jgi:hypothetical protein
MKILKNVLIVLACIIALPLIVALFIPKTYTVSVTQTINKPQSLVFNYVKLLDNQKKYSIWVMEDPNLNPEIIGTDGSVGAIMKWNSKLENVGEGEQQITALTNERMDVDLHFVRPFKGGARAATIVTAIDEQTCIVTSEFYSNSSYPLNLPSYIFGRKMLKEAQEKNLNNLKQILESSN